MTTRYREVAEVYPEIAASAVAGSGGVSSGAPKVSDVNLDIEGIGDLYNAFELAKDCELNNQSFN